MPMSLAVVRWTVAVSIICLGIEPVFGDRSIDFPTALELARSNNPNWRAAQQEVEITRGRLTTARLVSPFNPVVQGQGGSRTIPGEGRGAEYNMGLSMELEVAG